MAIKQKKLLSFIVATVLVSCFCFSAVPIISHAAEYTSGDYTYTTDGVCTITKYNGTDSVVAIPSTLDGKTVLSIGYGAFAGNDNIISVTIPDTMQIIEQYAFKDCSSLSFIDLGKGVKELGIGCLSGCSSLSAIVIPASLTLSSSMAGAPFKDILSPQNRSLKIATIASGGTTIPANLFSGCTTLEKVYIPEGITSIGPWAFKDCSSLKEVTIPDSVVTIGGSTFSGCTNLTHVTLGNKITYIGGGCFADCNSLSSIKIPASLTSAEAQSNYIAQEGPFYGCDALKAVSIEEGGVQIPERLFKDCIALETIKIPEGIISIGTEAFSGCATLRAVDLPQTLQNIEPYAFHKCVSLTEIKLPENFVKVGDNTFADCASLADLYDYSGSTEYKDRDNDYYSPGVFSNINQLTIHGFSGSTAETYAKKHGINFEPVLEKQIFRLYNKNSGEHFYTDSLAEKNNLISAGWNNEGIAWITPPQTGTPVYRIYNPNSGEHHYTMDVAEKDKLVSLGWRYEGIGWYSADVENSTPLYRLYNPNAKGQYEAGAHHYTKNKEEVNSLVAAGWRSEGIGWYGM